MYFGFENITIEYEGNRILEDITLEVPRGRVTSIIGRNGCGKTSLLKTIVGTLRPSGGRVICDGRPIGEYSKLELARRLAYLPQQHPSLSDLDVRTLVSYGRYPHRGFGSRLSERDCELVERAIALTGLTELAERSLERLSGGERQRAWIAMNIAREPEILVMDEPTTYLDIGCQLEVLRLVRRLAEELGVTILMVLHDINLAAGCSDIMCALKDKKIFAVGTPLEVMTGDNIGELFGISAQVHVDADSGSPFFVPQYDGLSAAYIK